MIDCACHAVFLYKGWEKTTTMTTKRKNIIAMVITLIVVWMGVEIGLLPFWIFTLSVVLYAIVIILEFWRPSFKLLLPAEAFDITDQGITRSYRYQLIRWATESIGWNEITKIWVMTTDEGPLHEDFFYSLSVSDDRYILVPGEIVVKNGLLGELQKRFSDLNNKAIIEASSCVEKKLFLVWEKLGLH
jgi:hypothetical protein